MIRQMEWIKGIALRIDNENHELARKKESLKKVFDATFDDNMSAKQ